MLLNQTPLPATSLMLAINQPSVAVVVVEHAKTEKPDV